MRGKQALYVILAIWVIIAVLLAGLLAYFITGNGGNRVSRWSFVPFRISLNGFSWDTTPLEQRSQDSFDASAVSSIALDCTVSDIKLVRADGEQITVTVRTNEAAKDTAAKVSLDGDTLRVTQAKQKFGIINYRQQVEIALPADWKKDVSCDVTTGDMDLSGDYVFGKVSFTGTTGDFTAGSLSADSLTVTGTTGDIDIDALDCPDYRLIRTTGDITADAVSGAGFVSTTTGDIVWDLTALTGGLDVSATTGDVDLRFGSSVGADVDAATSVGDVDADFDMTRSDRHSVGDRASGKIGAAPYQSVKVSTSVGDINLKKAG